jgi:MOSC domain-containing protein YiiM
MDEPVIEIGPTVYDRRDARNTLRSLPYLWRWLGEGRDVPATFGELVAAQAGVLAAFVGLPTVEIHDPARLEPLATRAFDHAGHDGVLLTEVLTRSLRLLDAARDALRGAGSLPATAVGHVVQISRSAGGVPKLAIDRADVGFGGVEGDRHAARQHHGRPWQALCIWSAEVIDAFVAGGHPLAYGAAGENITVRGLPWADVRPGVRVRLGDVLADVTAYSLPCSKNARWFRGGEYDLMSHERGPVSRVYASVREPGTIRPGDAAVLEPG